MNQIPKFTELMKAIEEFRDFKKDDDGWVFPVSDNLPILGTDENLTSDCRNIIKGEK